MNETVYEADVVIAGGGLAGMVTAYELLDQGQRVLILEKDVAEKFGGLAKESFGGIMMVDTPHQRRLGIKDTPDLAYADWERCAQFRDEATLPRQWAKLYCDASLEYIYHFLDEKKIGFLPVVNWPERGHTETFNTVPRWHITWGTGYEIAVKMQAALEAHPHRDKLQVLFEHEVNGFERSNGRVDAVLGKKMQDGSPFRAQGGAIVIASGGICGGDLSKLRANWFKGWGDAPDCILNGAHQYGNGLLHDRAHEQLHANLTNLDLQWNYAAGVHHPAQRKPNDGLSLVPPRSALWVNALGERIRNPQPIVPYTDTRHLVASIVQQPGQYSWQVMNWKIAAKELAVSGSDYMTAFREKSKLKLVKGVLFGNHELIRRLCDECPEDFVTADNLPDLVAKMNERNLYGLQTDLKTLEAEVDYYDGQIDQGQSYFNDEQLRWLLNFRTYRGDRIRLCKFQKIRDPKAMPLVAIREFILSRKSLGGLQTDLDSRVLDTNGQPIPGIYAVGEAAGFGGGGIHGVGSLEGTFLGGCVLTGRRAGQAIARG